jgi:hypothetical protein
MVTEKTEVSKRWGNPTNNLRKFLFIIWRAKEVEP